MYCSACGTKLKDFYAYCYQCGRPTNPDRTSPWGVPRSLSRPLWARKISGVCAGFARYFDVDVTVMRKIWLVTAIFTGVGFIAYLVAWIAMPAESHLVLPSPRSESAGLDTRSTQQQPDAEGQQEGFAHEQSSQRGFEEFRSAQEAADHSPSLLPQQNPG